jgi:hypothetical protein
MGVQVLEPAFPFNKMKTFLCLLSLAGVLLATTGCEVQERGGYYGPHEYHSGYYHHDGDHDGYWDRGHYYYR